MVVVALRALVLVVALGWMGVPAVFGLGCGGQAGSAPQEAVAAPAQSAPALVAATDAKPDERPLPDIAELLHAVETNQRAAEAVVKEYLYRSMVTEQQLDSHGGLKKSETREYEVFWLNGVPVQRLLKKDGRELTAEEQKKESERIDKDAAKARERRDKADERGKESDARGDELMTASRTLELGRFTNARRVSLNGRDTIVAEYNGDPKAKTKTRFEEVVRDMTGTVWIDEQDRVLVKAEGHFVNNFTIGGGLVAKIQKGTSFSMEQRKINDEVWLPAKVEGQGSARALLFFGFNGRVQAVESGYRKFKATSTIVPVDGTNTTVKPPQ